MPPMSAKSSVSTSERSVASAVATRLICASSRLVAESKSSRPKGVNARLAGRPEIADHATVAAASVGSVNGPSVSPFESVNVRWSPVS